ncbi:MAG: OmpA/MotB [Bacteroidetes bacterium]|jgi:hypothetical protein|nr:OmpA/MotB [Bacteroidota bacterium]
MKHLLIAILVSTSIAGYSQAYTNIVPDSSFEILNPGCGTTYGLGQIDSASTYWQSGNKGSTDLYHGCYFGPPFNAYMENYPSCIGGAQYPRTGGVFAGICAIDRPNRNLNYREYLQTQLLIPLEAGKKYYAGCHVSLGESYKRFSVNSFGLLFTDSVPAYDSSYFFGSWMQWGPIRQEAQVMNDTTINLMDTLGWILVADTFIAQGGEKWLTIGNFRNDAHSVFVPTNYNSVSSDSASYYFVDDVFLYCIDTSCATVPVIGIKETQTYRHNFGLYPNPAIHEITVEIDAFNDQKSALLRIYDLAGRLRKSDELLLHSGKGITSIADLPNGAYFVEVIMNGFVRSVQKLIILK